MVIVSERWKRQREGETGGRRERNCGGGVVGVKERLGGGERETMRQEII